MSRKDRVFTSYAVSIETTGVTLGVQRRQSYPAQQFLDLVLVVPVCIEGTIARFCFNVDSGAYNRDVYDEVQVPPVMYSILLKQFKRILGKARHLPEHIHQQCQIKIETALELMSS